MAGESAAEAGKGLNTLALTAGDVRRISLYFEGKSREEITLDMEKAIIRVINGTVGMVPYSSMPSSTGAAPWSHVVIKAYFLRAAKGFGTRIWNGLQQDCMAAVMHQCCIHPPLFVAYMLHNYQSYF
ncbi:hypothetical protein [Clostridium sp. 1001271st1 H5]|uniref:hypothetical protein n=1 Tax=Clostridium sp. 1001271st1 H5 TaxID=2559708 RepID=UPI0015B4EE69|nr:hypothetical protein [Clostridium sp. 1001271st1 H5]